MTYNYRANIVRIIDGDTAVADVDLGFRIRMQMPVRLAGIDAPEVNAPGPEGEASRDWLRDRLPVGQPVELVTVKPADKYGRYLAWVYAGGNNINQEMLDTGKARPYDGGPR